MHVIGEAIEVQEMQEPLTVLRSGRRHEDALTDALIDQLQRSTDISSQKRAVYGLERILMEKFPTIALWYGAHWFEYSTKHAIGWLNERNPYAGPTDGLLIITHLRPAQ
jgi:peptide/nickel transport system substrate-binding protein